MRVKFSGGRVEPRGDVSATNRPNDPHLPEPITSTQPAAPTPVVTTTPAPFGHEEVSRIRVEPEDRLAFRVGVNILTLVLLGLAVYLLWRRFFAGG